MGLVRVEAYTAKVPLLVTAEEIAERAHIPAARILELAETGYMPYWRVDGGTPLFDKVECKRWIEANLTQKYDGKRLPTVISLSSPDPLLRPCDLPLALQKVQNLIDLTHVVDQRSGIYFLCFGDDVVYVGQSINVSLRVVAHVKVKEFDRVIFLPWPASDLDRIEGAIIRTLRPKLNGQIGKDYLCAPNAFPNEQELIAELGLTA